MSAEFSKCLETDVNIKKQNKKTECIQYFYTTRTTSFSTSWKTSIGIKHRPYTAVPGATYIALVQKLGHISCIQSDGGVWPTVQAYKTNTPN